MRIERGTITASTAASRRLLRSMACSESLEPISAGSILLSSTQSVTLKPRSIIRKSSTRSAVSTNRRTMVLSSASTHTYRRPFSSARLESGMTIESSVAPA